MNKVLEVKNLYKSYGDTTVIKGLSLSIRKGEIYALLGPNGAGKTTTLECIEGIRDFDSGEVRLFGKSYLDSTDSNKHRIGIQLQDSGLPDEMTVNEAINLFSTIKSVEKNSNLIRYFNLDSIGNKKYRELSTGQKRRLNLFLATSHNPDIVFLDEPTAELDVEVRKNLHAYIRNLKKEGTTIILSSHDMAEVESLADRVGIILDGKILLESSPKEITASGENLTKVSIKLNNGKILNYHSSYVQRSFNESEYMVLFTRDTVNLVTDLMEHIKNRNLQLNDFRVERPNLEEMFINIIKSNKEMI